MIPFMDFINGETLEFMPISGIIPVARHSEVTVRPRVLIVDDHPAIRRALRKEFERAGWDVCAEASTGREAIAKAEEHEPQVIVLDLAMPEMNGITTARQLKKMFLDVHLILFTAHGDLFRADEASSAGISAVCSKSDPVAVLLDKAKALATQNSSGVYH